MNVDVEQLLNDQPLDDELRDIVSVWYPDTVLKEGVEVELSRDEYLEEIAEFDHHEESIKDFHNHPCDVIELNPSRGILIYKLEPVEYDVTDETWEFEVEDNRQDSDEPDMMVRFSLPDDYDTDVTHLSIITDNQFRSWMTFVDDVRVTDVSVDDDISAPKYHRVLHDRGVLLQTTEKFVEELENASIDPAATW